MSHTREEGSPTPDANFERSPSETEGDLSKFAGDAAREANLLATCSLAVADRVRAATESELPHGASAPAALLALHTFLGGGSVDALARVLGLTHSGTVRLVDRLEAGGLLARSAGADGRARSLALTAAGRRTAERLQERRRRAAAAVLDPLDADERATLAALLERLLAGMTSDRQSARHICRMCDVDACGHHEGRCPVTLAADRATLSGA